MVNRFLNLERSKYEGKEGRINVRINATLEQALENEIQATYSTRSKVVRRALIEYLSKRNRL